jgi:hypothetical protein
MEMKSPKQERTKPSNLPKVDLKEKLEFSPGNKITL